MKTIFFLDILLAFIITFGSLFYFGIIFLPNLPIIPLSNPAPNFSKNKKISYFEAGNKKEPDGEGAVLPKGTSLFAVFDGTIETKQLIALAPNLSETDEKINVLVLTSSDGSLKAFYYTKGGSVPVKTSFKKGSIIATVGNPMDSSQGNSLLFKVTDKNLHEKKIIYMF